MSATKRLQLFINKDVLLALKKYMNDKYGPDSRNTSSAIQSILVAELKREGYWPGGGKLKQTD